MAATEVFGITVATGSTLADTILPTQSGNNKKALKSNGSTASWGNAYENVFVPNTTTLALTTADDQSIITNTGAADVTTITLPTAVAGLEFTILVTEAFAVTITANTDDVIRIGGSVSAAAGTAVASAIGSVVKLVAIDDTTWLSLATTGTWVVT